MNKKPLVSIITVTLNRESLKNACESVRKQTYKNYHHYVLGDGVLPTDYSNEKCTCLGFSTALGATEPGANMPNGTPNPMQRWALKNLDLGDYVCFLDDDNVYRPTFLEKMVEALNNNSTVGIALCGAKDYRYGQNLAGFPEDFMCDNSAFMARRNVVKSIEFPRASMDKNVVQDCEYIKLCAKQYGFVNVPHILLDFGVADNVPPQRGKVYFLESWKKPFSAYEDALAEKYEQAINILKETVDCDKNDAWSQFKLVEIYTILQNKTECEKHAKLYLQTVNSLDIQHSYLFYTKAFCKCILGDDYKNDLELSIQKISEDLYDESNYFFYSTYELLNGNISKAVELYNIAISKFPDDDFWANKEFNWMIRIYSYLTQSKQNTKLFKNKCHIK